jgi:hypothetical protein
LFQIQPLIAKIILPWFGGTSAVWISGEASRRTAENAARQAGTR